MVFVSPLRYPGGKGKLANYIKLVFRFNNLMDGHYVEPFAGGSAIALQLLYNEYATHIHINDFSKSIFSFWHSVLNETDELCSLIENTTVSIDEWYKQKEIQLNSDYVSLLELGFSTFFLNRTNRSGILAGGIIGGKGQNGKYKIDARFNKPDLLHRIKKVARYKGRISLYNEDAEKLILNLGSELPERSLFYLDPPYYIKGKGLYDNYYEHKDHLSISRIVSRLKNKWIVSYDITPEIQSMYDDFQMISYRLNYSAANHQESTEVMYFCDDLCIPPINNPAKITNSKYLSILQNEFPIL